MNHIHYSQRLILRTVAAVFLLTSVAMWMGGCGDERKAPLISNPPTETETIILWNDAPAGDNVMVSAPFTVRDPLAEITDPSMDTPARLRVVAYIRPDCQVLRREDIVNDLIPSMTDDVIIPTLISIDSLKRALDSLSRVRTDSVESFQRSIYGLAGWSIDFTDSTPTYGGMTCDTALYTFQLVTDTPDINALMARRDSVLQLLPSSVNEFETRLMNAQLDTSLMGFERNWLSEVVDNRYRMALWLDDTNLDATYPEAVFMDDGSLSGQEMYLAQTDTSTGYKARGFEVDLNRFNAADVNNPTYTIEVNWVTCFPGSDRPCLGQGDHTLYARITGGAPMSRISGTLVLVYERALP